MHGMSKYAEFCYGGLKLLPATISAFRRVHFAWLDRVGDGGEIVMLNGKVDLDALVEETMAFAKSVRVEPTIPRTIVGPKPDAISKLGESRSARRSGVTSPTSRRISSASRREREDYAAVRIKANAGASILTEPACQRRAIGHAIVVRSIAEHR